MFTGKLKQMARNGASARSVMGLPDVETGSILEYGYHVAALEDGLSYSGSLQAPWWQVRQAYHVCAAHFVLRTDSMDRASVRWVSNIPAGSEVRWRKNRVELDVSDVAPLPNEEFTPPVSSLKSQVRFFYWTGASGSYWGRTGDSVDSVWKDFYSPTKELIGAVNQIISPADTDEQKLHRIYDAVTALENTDLTRERSEREDRQAGFKEAKKSQDIWRRKRGNSQELALLFIAFARAAGFNAYPMGVTSRDSAIFNPEVLSWSQIDSTIVVINWKGQVHFLDPGCRGCPYGHLAWWHSNVHGVSFEGKDIVFRETPLEPASANQTLRAAELTLDEQGAVTGTVTMRFADNATIPFRRQLLREDQQAVEAALEKDLQEEMPIGVQTKLLSLNIPADYSSVIVARFSVTGTLGTTVGKRLMLPAHLFAFTSKPLLTPVSRTLPVSFAEEYALKDVVRIQLPASLAVESLPQSRALKLARDVDFAISASKTDHTIRIERFYVLYRLNYPVNEYPALHNYFAQVADANQEQLVLQPVKP